MSKRTCSMTCPLYKQPIYFIAGNDEAKTHGLKPNELWGAYTISKDGCVYIGLRSRGDYTHGIIAHEAVHAAWIILGIAGVKTDRRNNEAMAYLVEWIVNSAASFFSCDYTWSEDD